MNEKQVRKSMAVVIIGVVLAGLIALIGLEWFIDSHLTLILLWVLIGFCATAVGHLVSLLLLFFRDKNYLWLCLPLCTGIQLLAVYLLARHESHGFMGNLGAGIIMGIFGIPVVAAFLFWSVMGIVFLLKQRK